MISIYPVHPSSHRVSRWTKRPSTGRQKTTNVYLDDLVRRCSQTWQPGCALGCLRTFFWCSHDAQVGLLGLIIFSFSSQTIFKRTEQLSWLIWISNLIILRGKLIANQVGLWKIVKIMRFGVISWKVNDGLCNKIHLFLLPAGQMCPSVILILGALHK